MKISLPEVVGKGYGTFWKFKGRYTVVKGGRASKKSTTTALWIVYNMMKYPLSNTLVVRQVFNTQRDSTFKQLQWATERLGVAHLWNFKVSPLEAEYIPTGQKIMFRGLDNPQSITSITVAKGFLTYCWFEEAFQIESEDAFNKIDMSLRGELPEDYFRRIFLTFNPWSDSHWINERFFKAKDDRVLALTTNYMCNEWLDGDTIANFEWMKENSPRRYSVEGLGQWGIIEGLVFDNFIVEDFDYKHLKGDHIVGMDWGFSADPTTIIQTILLGDKLYIYDETYEVGLLNSDIVRVLREKELTKSLIVADSAEPKSIAELKQLGITRIKPAKKGPDSIRAGINRLKEYQIIIHPSCYHTIEEFNTYSWQKDKTGKPLPKPEDKFNHCIDAIRYASEEFVKNKIKTFDKRALGL